MMIILNCRTLFNVALISVGLITTAAGILVELPGDANEATHKRLTASMSTIIFIFHRLHKQLQQECKQPAVELMCQLSQLQYTNIDPKHSVDYLFIYYFDIYFSMTSISIFMIFTVWLRATHATHYEFIGFHLLVIMRKIRTPPSWSAVSRSPEGLLPMRLWNQTLTISCFHTRATYCTHLNILNSIILII